MTKAGIYAFMAAQRLGVVSSVGQDGAPQSALVGIAVTPGLEIVFDTLEASRKAQNLCRNPKCSFVIGWAGEVTVQVEGFAENYGQEEEGLRAYLEIYFRQWPECREHLTWPGITYFVLSPTWLRYSDFEKRPPEIVEISF
jgi:pyridoxine/pyridoxamine 5'-phosphate oxidase